METNASTSTSHTMIPKTAHCGLVSGRKTGTDIFKMFYGALETAPMIVE